MTQKQILCHTLSHNPRAWLKECIVSDVSIRRSARAQAAAGQQQFQQIANHCWLTAAARARRAKPNEYSWSRMFDLEQNLQHQSTRLNQNCRARRTEKSGSLFLNKCEIIFFAVLASQFE